MSKPDPLILDRLGNFLYKDDSNNAYVYTGCNAGPHAVCSANGTTFTYDANGNMIASTDAKVRNIEYSAFNKPELVTEDASTVNFVYGADRARVFKQSLADGSVEVTWYVGVGAEGKPLYEQNAVISAGQIVKREHLNFIYAGGHHGGQPFAVRVVEEEEDNNSGTPNLILYGGTEYYHRDHLGSVIAITGDSGAVENTRLLSFDAWGKRRNSDWTEGASTQNEIPVDQYTRNGMRGNLAYTGHEAVPEVGLIHMNGRVYDPELGVFLSADPEVQAPTYSQNYNRYSYVLNNPIRYTDPSGYNFLENMSENLVTFIGIALNFIPGCQFWCSAVFMAAHAYANGATLGQALFIGGVAFVAGGFGQGVGGGMLGGLVSGAISGGFNAALNGGDFLKGAREGAKRGAASALVMDVIKGAIEALQPKLYLVSKDSNGEFTKITPVDEVTTDYLAINGQANDLERAAKLMGEHVEAANHGAVNEYTLIHNPTAGFLTDTFESFLDKIGLTTDVAKYTAGVLAKIDHPVHVVAHSQGGVIFSEAVRYHMANGGGALSNIQVTFHAGANNAWVTNGIMGNAGVKVNGYRTNPYDLVPNVIGFNSFNPVKVIGSILRSPTLAIPALSPHTHPYTP